MLRLLQLLGGLSVATDMGTGAPLEESLKRCVVATRLARSTSCPTADVHDVVYTSLLEHLGCTAFSHELAGAFGDDNAAIRAGFKTDWTDSRDVLRTFVPDLARATGRSRARVMATALRSGPQVDREGPVATCEVARDAARRLDLPGSVQDGLFHVTAMWDGAGHPAVAGSDIPLATRVMHVASVATLFCLLAGPDRAIEEVRRRSGTYLDPDLAASMSTDLLDGVPDLDAFDELLALEPDPVRLVDQGDIERVARIFGDLADLKSPWLQGHSAAVADLAATSAQSLGLGADEVSTLRVAGHLHDLGRVGVSSRIWDKPTRLSTSERAQVQLHPWHTEQILARVPARGPASRAHRWQRLPPGLGRRAAHDAVPGASRSRSLPEPRRGPPSPIRAGVGGGRGATDRRGAGGAPRPGRGGRSARVRRAAPAVPSGPSGGPDRPADRRTPARGCGTIQPRDRGRPDHLAPHGRASRAGPLRQDRRVLPGRSGTLRDGARPVGDTWVGSPMRRASGGQTLAS